MALRHTTKVDLNLISDKASESPTTICIIILYRGYSRSF